MNNKTVSKPHSVMLHHFHDKGVYIHSQGSIDYEEFDNLIQYYREKGFRILDAKEWYTKALEKSLENNEICFSFDDGLKCQYDIASEVLEKNKITAFFFVPSQRFIGERENLELFRHFRFSKFKDISDFYQAFFAILEQSDIYNNKGVEIPLKDFKAREYLEEFSFYTDEDRKFRYIRDRLLEEEEYYQLMFEMMDKYGYDMEEAEKNLYFSKEDLLELHHAGHIIGLHSHSHYTNLAGGGVVA